MACDIKLFPLNDYFLDVKVLMEDGQWIKNYKSICKFF